MEDNLDIFSGLVDDSQQTIPTYLLAINQLLKEKQNKLNQLKKEVTQLQLEAPTLLVKEFTQKQQQLIIKENKLRKQYHTKITHALDTAYQQFKQEHKEQRYIPFMLEIDKLNLYSYLSESLKLKLNHIPSSLLEEQSRLFF